MRQLMVGGLVASLMTVGLVTGWTQETKPTTEKPAAAAEKPSNRLPNNYGKLELSGAQKDSIYQVQDKYASEIDALIKQVETLRQKRDAEIAAVLTKEQQAKLKELVAEATKKAAAKKATAKPTTDAPKATESKSEAPKPTTK